jgi:alpha-glucosidase
MRQLELPQSFATINASSPPITLASPSGRLRFSIYEGEASRYTYSIVGPKGDAILPSTIRLISDGKWFNMHWRYGARIVYANVTDVATEWHNPWGERSRVPDIYKELVLGLARRNHTKDQGPGPDAMAAELFLIARIYDYGVALRHVVAEHARAHELWQHIVSEQVEFNLPSGSSCYWTEGAQRVYKRMPIADWPKPCEGPLTIEHANGQWISLLQAGQVNFPRTRYRLGRATSAPAATTTAGLTTPFTQPDQVLTQLGGTLDFVAAGFATPWHLVMVADKPGDLLEHNYIVLNLNPPSRLPKVANGAKDEEERPQHVVISKDTTAPDQQQQARSWIQPGRVLRLMTFTRDVNVVRAQMAFAADQNITYVHLDAGWYGDEYDPQSDASRWDASRLDLPTVIREAKSRGLRVILYVNQIALERQIDVIFPLYRFKWGVDGVKFGFVHAGPQNWTLWLHEAVKKAAQHHLVVDIHDDYRPTGFSRTYPNLLQVEGIQGDELWPMANQSTIYPFTRFIAGHADHTYCFLHPRLKKTRAHQLALSVVNFGPLQYLYWYDQPDMYKAVAKRRQVEFWKEVPTVWDDTRVVDADPGSFVIIARRSGADWWLGAVTDERDRAITISLGFLSSNDDKGAVAAAAMFDVVAYEDSDGGRVVRRDLAAVAAVAFAGSGAGKGGGTLDFKLRASGGVAIRFRRRSGES